MLFIWENQESKKDKKKLKMNFIIFVISGIDHKENELDYSCQRWLIRQRKKLYLNNFWSKKAPILISARSTDDECNIHMTNEVCLEFHENCGAKCNHFEYNMNWIPCMESCFDLTILECSWKYSSGNSLLHNLLSHVLNSGKKNDYYCVTEVRKVIWFK